MDSVLVISGLLFYVLVLTAITAIFKSQEPGVIVNRRASDRRQQQPRRSAIREAMSVDRRHRDRRDFAGMSAA